MVESVEMHEDMMERALEWFTHDETGIEEPARRFLYKSMVKGYKETTPDGRSHTVKLTLKWFRKQIGDAEWKSLKKDLGVGMLIGFGGGAVSTWVMNVCRIHNDNWSPEVENFINGLFAIAIGTWYARTMDRLYTQATKTVKEVTGDDEGISEVG